jgi:L-amino acid N-acyltransferase YncA
MPTLERCVIVRPAQPADAPRIADIYAHYVATSAATFDETPPGSEEMAATMARIVATGLPFLVSETRGAVDGYGYLSPYRPRAAYRYTVESSVYVAPEARGRGLGRALLEGLLAEAQQAGLHEVVAVIAVTDDPASVALHRTCGFSDAGLLKRVGFKHGRWLDTLFMQRSLSP